MATATAPAPETPLCGAPTKKKKRKCRQPVPHGSCQYHGLRHAAVRQLLGVDGTPSGADATAAHADPFADVGLDEDEIDTRERVSYMQLCIREILERPNGLGTLLRLRQSQHDYSMRNLINIMFQDPDATMVGPASMWKAMGYEVNEGEKPIMTWVPRTYKKRKRDENGDFVKDDDGKFEYEGPTQTRFELTGKIYDIRQTNAPPIDSGVEKLTGEAPAELKSRMITRADELGIPVTYKPLKEGLGGFYDRKDGANGSITINASDEDAEQVSTLIHELAHSQDPGLRDGPADEYRRHRGEAEAVAEATAFAIADRYGMDTSGYSMGYVGGWIRGNIDTLDTVFDRIDAATKSILPPTPMQQAMTAARDKAKEEYDRKRAEQRKAKDDAKNDGSS